VNKASDVTKRVAAQHPGVLAAKGSLVLRIPVGMILLGVNLDRGNPLTRKWVGSVILPLCQPMVSVRYEKSSSMGDRYYGGDLTTEGAVLRLEDLVSNELLAEWERLADVEQCIEHLATSQGFNQKPGPSTIHSLICLAAYQRTYDRCLGFIQDYRDFLLTERGKIIVRNCSLAANPPLIETVEKGV